MPCIGCGVEGRIEAAHTGSDGGMSQKASDYSCVPLCADCHTQAPAAYHRIGKRPSSCGTGLGLRPWSTGCSGNGVGVRVKRV